MRNERHRLAWRAVRASLGLQSMVAGVFSAVQWDATVAFNAEAVGSASSVASALGVALLVVGGASLLGGYGLRFGAACLLLFLVPATLRHLVVAQAIQELTAAHPMDDIAMPLAAYARRGQLACLAKNVPLIAVAVCVFFHGKRSDGAPQR